jgi:hypothetical protein
VQEDLADFALAVKTWTLCHPFLAIVQGQPVPAIRVHEVEAALIIATTESKARGRPMSRASAWVHIDPVIERLDADPDGLVTFVELVQAIHCEVPSESSLLSILGRQQVPHVHARAHARTRTRMHADRDAEALLQ